MSNWRTVGRRLELAIAGLTLCGLATMGCSSKQPAPPKVAKTGSSASKATGNAASDSTSSESGTKPAATNGAAGKSKKVALRILEPPPVPLFPPTVVMSEGHSQTCLVQVGDLLPELTAVELNGDQRALKDLFGEKLTVVVFWHERGIFAQEQFTRLQQEVATPFDRTGVQVIAIAVNDDTKSVGAAYKKSGGTFACLVDPQGAAFAQVAKEKLPRTYVLDPSGKILWFDIEYSRSTRRELENAIRYFLQPPTDSPTAPPADPST